MIEQSGYLPRQRTRARRTFLGFVTLNAFSFFLVSGNIVTLFAIQLGASSLLIGILSAFQYSAFFSLLLGKRLVPRFGVVRTFAAAWALRSACVALLLVVPLLIGRGYRFMGFAVLVAALFGFQLFRGIGLISNSPVMGELSTGRDRGAYLARVQITASVSAVCSSAITALLLVEDSPLWRFSFCFSLGVTAGLVASSLAVRLPEPPSVQQGGSISLLQSFATAMKQSSFLRFLISFALLGAVTGIGRTFLVVYVKQIYDQPDRAVAFYTMIGHVGIGFMGILARQVMDRLGAKPIYIFFALIFLVSLLPIVAPVRIVGSLAIVLFSMLLFFLNTLGLSGVEYCAQVYFFGLVSPKERLNLGVVYFLTLGLGGSIGVAVGGAVLQAMQETLTLPAEQIFSLFFGGLSLLLIGGVVFGLARLERLGADTVRNTLSVLFSPRLMRTMVLMNRLDRSTSIHQEKQVIGEMARSRNPMVGDNLVARLKSPSFVIRSQALHAMEHQPLSMHIVEALIREIEQQEFTTAYVAARICGVRLVRQAIPALRRQLRSADYMLSAKCMVALARLKDSESLAAIEDILLTTSNPLVLTHGAAALRIFRLRSSLPLLLQVLRKATAPTNVSTEIVLSIGEVLDLGGEFYRQMRHYQNNPDEAFQELQAHIAENCSELNDYADFDLLLRAHSLQQIDRPMLAQAIRALSRRFQSSLLDPFVPELEIAQSGDDLPFRFMLLLAINHQLEMSR